MASTRSEARVGVLPPPSPGQLLIDGVAPAVFESPASAQEVAHLLAAAADEGRAVAPVGSGSMLSLGNIPERIDVALTTERLNRVLHYEPTDLTLSAEAGVRFGDVQALLAERGQSLPVEAPNPERATLGGMVATAWAGPRRLGSGTLRDLIIGITVAYPNGTVGKAGGLVVKNVTGFDLMRLHHGALGTLGVITSVNFKVLPRARSETTLLYEVASLDRAWSVAKQAMARRSGLVASEMMRKGEGWRLSLRFEGRPSTVDLIVADVVAVAGTPSERLVDEQSADWWSRYVRDQEVGVYASEVLLRVATTPSRGEQLASVSIDLLAEQGLNAEMLAVSPGLGIVTMRVGLCDATVHKIGPLQQRLLSVAETVTILAAPPAVKQTVDVWGRVPATIDVMRALKREFDPSRVLNPGRFVGGI